MCGSFFVADNRRVGKRRIAEPHLHGLIMIKYVTTFDASNIQYSDQHQVFLCQLLMSSAMFRPTARRILSQSAPRNVTRTTQTRRFLSTAPPHEKSRSWKNSALRWTLAGSLVYYYNTSSVFAEEPSCMHNWTWRNGNCS